MSMTQRLHHLTGALVQATRIREGQNNRQVRWQCPNAVNIQDVTTRAAVYLITSGIPMSIVKVPSQQYMLVIA